MIKRCPQCGSASDDQFGFCIKCGYEFSKIKKEENICPLCKYENPDEADYCVKCGTPLVFKKQFNEDSALNPIVIKKEINNDSKSYHENKTSSWLIIFGYIFSILGGILGLIIAIYLSTRKDSQTRKHGHIQLAIFLFYILLIVILFVTGNMPSDIITQYRQLMSGNFTFI